MSAETAAATGAPAGACPWTEALDQIEAEIAAAQQLLAQPADHDEPTDRETQMSAAVSSALAWTPAAGLGPLPAHLQARAQAVLNRQQAVTAELAEAMQSVRRHQRVVTSLVHRNAPQAVYVDMVG